MYDTGATVSHAPGSVLFFPASTRSGNVAFIYFPGQEQMSSEQEPEDAQKTSV